MVCRVYISHSLLIQAQTQFYISHFAEVHTIVGNVTVPVPLYRGRSLDTNNKTIRNDLGNMNSALAQDLVRTIEPEVRVFSQVMLCYLMLCCVMLCYVMFCYVMLCYVMLCYVMLCYVMLCYVMLCYVMLCYVMLCYVML